MDFDKRLPVSETGVYVSEGFAVILEKMMELSPQDRYQNGGEYLKAIRNCSKLDHRYILMHRKQMGIQAAALACLGLGILTIFGGVYKLRAEKNSAYYGLVAQAEEVMNLYDYSEAENLLAEAKAVSGTRVEAYEEEVYLLYLSESYEECIALGEQYINTTPFLLSTQEDKEEFGNIFYIVGNAYFETEDYANAGNLFEHALEYNESNGLYYRDYAIALAKLGQTEAAEEQLERGIDLGLAQDSIYMAQGEIAHVQGQYEQAADYLNQTISTTDDMQLKKRAVLLCADVYKTMGNDGIDQEIALLEQYGSQFEGNGSMVMTEYLADAYARKGDADEANAAEYYQKALTLFEEINNSGYVTFQNQQNMAILYEDMGDFDRAEAVLLEMADSYPKRYEVYKRLAFLEADRQQTKDNADRDYTQMQSYYEEAVSRYDSDGQDLEMDMLEQMMQELRDGGWL
jgi:serine/threonine-protein kinase